MEWSPLVISLIVGGVLGVIYVLANLQRGIDGRADFPMPSVAKVMFYASIGLLITALVVLARWWL